MSHTGNVFKSNVTSYYCRITEVLPLVLDQWGLPEYPEFEDNFPSSIKLCQAIATWKCVVVYQRNLLV